MSSLFHGCCLAHLLGILRDDRLERGFAYPKRGSAVSFSRSFEVAKWFLDLSEAPYHLTDPLGGVLVFNRQQLNSRYRIQCFRDSRCSRNEFEEIILRDVGPVGKYLQAIVVDSQDLVNARSNIQWQDKILGEPLGFEDRHHILRCLNLLENHPKLQFQKFL